MVKQQIRLKFELKKPAPPRLPWILGLLLLAFFVALLGERWRGQWLVNKWKAAMALRGTSIDPLTLWPASDHNSDFSNRVAQALAELPKDLREGAAGLRSIIQIEPGVYHRGSQAALASISATAPDAQSWDRLQQLVQESEASLSALRRLFFNAPSAPDYNVREFLETDRAPNLLNLRQAAQVLNAASLTAVRSHDLDQAAENLAALSACVNVYSHDPLLVTYITRHAILALAIEAYWDALHEDGWTDAQLIALQRACAGTNLLSELPRPMQAEIAQRVYHLESFRARSYRAWFDRYLPVYQSVQAKGPQISFGARLWRQWVFHPLWSFAWADLEQLHYLRTIEPDIIALRNATEGGSWHSLKQELDENRRQDPRLRAGWRFYGNLPLMETASSPAVRASNPIKPKSRIPYLSGITSFLESSTQYSYPDFSRTWQASLRNLTLHQMLTAAIALKRYQLHHGQPPATLQILVPEYLPALPRDLMDGQPIRYRLNPDQTFTLYSVGADGVDDGASQQITEPSLVSDIIPAWTSRDYVWPQISRQANDNVISMHPQQLGQ